MELPCGLGKCMTWFAERLWWLCRGATRLAELLWKTTWKLSRFAKVGPPLESNGEVWSLLEVRLEAGSKGKTPLEDDYVSRTALETVAENQDWRLVAGEWDQRPVGWNQSRRPATGLQNWRPATGLQDVKAGGKASGLEAWLGSRNWRQLQFRNWWLLGCRTGGLGRWCKKWLTDDVEGLAVGQQRLPTGGLAVGQQSQLTDGLGGLAVVWQRLIAGNLRVLLPKKSEGFQKALVLIKKIPVLYQASWEGVKVKKF